jgi:hypothetical protein
MDCNVYRKIVLNGLNINNKSQCICVTNYDIPKNCNYYLLTDDIYVIGYNIDTNYGSAELPVFSREIEKRRTLVNSNIMRYHQKLALLDCGFPQLVVVKILSFFD